MRSAIIRVLTRSFLVGAAAGLLLSGAASAESNRGRDLFLSSLPEAYRYGPQSRQRRQPLSVSFRRSRHETRAVAAPTRYRTKSILRYTKALGDTGMLFRVKLPLKRSKLIKLELRF
jgi:hypothetical protein